MASQDRHTLRGSPLARACLLGALILLASVWVPGSKALALEGDDTAAYWQQERQRSLNAKPLAERPTRLLRRQAPQRAYVPDTAPAVDATTPAGDAAAGQPPVQAGAQPAPNPALPTYTVMVIGDSLGQMMSQGLTEAFADSKNVVILAKARENTGLVRDDYFDWVKGARELAASAGKIDLVVMMIGSNDNQAIREGQTSHEPLTPRWKELYSQRIAAVDQAFRERNLPLVWVGAPIVRSERLAAVLLQANEMARAQAAAHQIAYVDVWDAFADERGQFSAYGPDLNGQTNKIRSGDGVHFTKAGARKLAHFVETDLRRTIEAFTPAALTVPQASVPDAKLLDATGPAPQAGLDPNLVPLPGDPLPSGLGASAPAVQKGDLQAALPAPNAPLLPVIAVKPPAGPVVALTAPVISPNGQLAIPAGPAPPVRRAGDPGALATQVLVEGRPVDPRADRADDFSWPKSR